MNEAVFTNEKKYEFLETRCSFLDLIIEDLKRYMIKSLKIRSLDKENIIKTNQISTSKSINQDLFAYVYEGFYNHKTNIELRLNFIKYTFPLLKDFTNKDIYYHIINLWDIFYETEYYEKILIDFNNDNMDIDREHPNIDSRQTKINIMEEEQNLFLNIFNDNNDGSLSRFSTATSKYLFKNILISDRKFNPKKINLNAFKIFSKFFYLINQQENKIINIRGKYLVKDIELLGQDSLWNILVKTNKDNVRIETAKVIVNNNLNLIKFSSDFSNKVWSNFISKLLLYFNDCMDIYSSNLNNNIQEKGDGIKGLLLLIKKLLEKIDDQYITSQEEIFFSDIGFEIQIRFPSKNQQKIMKIDRNETIYDIRCKISYFFDIPIMNVGLKNMRKNSLISCNDDANLAFDLIDRNTTLDIVILPNPILKINENPKNLILENSYIFQSLFSILKNPDCEFINDAWELINLMPKNKDLESKIINLGNQIFNNPEKEFSDCFDLCSLYHLSYSIQILKTILNQNDIENWLTTFSKNKGKFFFFEMLSNLRQPFYRKANKTEKNDKTLIYDLENDFVFSSFYLQLILDILYVINIISKCDKDPSVIDNVEKESNFNYLLT